MKGVGANTTLTELQLMSATTVNAGFGNVEWYVCHTSLNELTTTFDNNYNGNTPQKVYANSVLTINAVNKQWFGFTFTPTFVYNSTSNLIFELRYGSNNGNTINAFGATVPKRVVEAGEPNGATGSYGPYDWMPSLRIYHGATGLITLHDMPEQCALFSIARNKGTSFLIHYSITKPSEVSIALYDMAGCVVKTLEKSNQDAGSRSLSINTGMLTSGMYFINFKAGEYSQNKKLALCK